MLVDDADDVRGVVRTQLQLSRLFRVTGEGRTGLDAIELARRLQPSVMLLDASMPEMDGIEALPAILGASPSTRVVMLSGFRSGGLEQAARLLGAVGFLDKGIPLHELPERLRRIADAPDAAPAPAATSLGRARPAGEPAVLPDARVPASSEMLLARHLERFRTVFDRAAIGMVTTTLTGTIVRANGALCEMLGRDESTLVGRPLGDIACADDAAAVVATLQDVGAGKRDVGDVEHRTTRSPDQWLHWTFAVVRGADGQPLYLFAQADDVTERKQALLDLRHSDERFRLLVAGVREYAIFMLDPEGHISSWNNGAERMKGWSAEEIIGRHFRVFYPPREQETRHPEHELAIASAEGRYEEEGWRVRKDGSRFWANVVITALRDDEGRLVGFGKVTRDVTERREAEGRLQAALDQTAQFVAITAHELSSPVAAIAGGADLLWTHWRELDDEHRLESVAAIRGAGERLRRLVADLVLASRLEGSGAFELTPEDLPLGAVIRETLAELPGGLGERVVLDVPAGLTVRADRSRVAQLVTNLVSNAVRHGTPPVEVAARPRGRHVVVSVRDTGPGIPEELRPRLFRKFARLPGASGRGTGLGLFIVRELARAQGGDAWYEGRSDEPTCFAFSLPAAGTASS